LWQGRIRVAAFGAGALFVFLCVARWVVAGEWFGRVFASTMDIETYTGGFFQTNGYRVVTTAGTILVDAPEGITEWLADRGETIDALLLTHLHIDHVVDVAAIKGRFACPVWAHSQPDSDLTLETFLKETIGWPFQLNDFAVDHLLADDSRLRPLGENGPQFELLHVPGHSPDSLCFVEAAEGLMFDGDVLMAGGLGRSDFPHGDGSLLLQGIEEKLLPMDDAIRILPGHGPETTIGAERVGNPFLQ
jgi:glyoxylase-like metal-dependent hydrolase (beta-lactamase superfamily II)